MKFVVEIVYPNIFRKYAPMTHVEECYHAVDAIRVVRDWQRIRNDNPKQRVISYKITLVKE